MDTLGWGVVNGIDPAGSMPSVAVSGNVNAGTITLTDPSPPAPPTPTVFSVFAGDKSALIAWNTLTSNGVEMADTYDICIDGADPEDCLKIPARGGGTGHAFYSVPNFNGSHDFQLGAEMDGQFSNLTAPFMITIGPQPGGHTVAGSVTLPDNASPNSYLYVALCRGCTGGGPLAIYLTSIETPGSKVVPYSIPGVTDGTYQLLTVMDNNNDSFEDGGDWFNALTDIHPQVVTMSGTDLAGVDLSLPGTNSSFEVTTQTYKGKSFQSYTITFEVFPQTKLPVNVTLTSGAHFDLPIDLAKHPHIAGEFSPPALNIEKAPSGSYALAVTYSDGSTETVTPPPVTVLNSFATPTYPLSIDCCDLTPNFIWTAPSSPPASYSYFLRLYPGGPGTGQWYYPNPNSITGMPTGQTSVVYNIDGMASQPALTMGTQYYWEIAIQDANRNLASYQTSYIP
jgi:hypothetical protein